MILLFKYINMKKTLIITTLICSLFLVGCNKTDETVDVQPEPAEFSEEQRIEQMIKLIEAEEARMIESGETE